MEPLTDGYSSDGTQQEPSNEYQHGRVQNNFRMFCVLVPLMKVAPALDGVTGVPYSEPGDVNQE